MNDKVMKVKVNILIKKDFLPFAAKAIFDLEGVRISNDQYLELLATKAADFEKGACLKLAVNLPPRHNKTNFFAICLIAWILGRDPTKKIMLLATSEELAEADARKILSIMKMPWYRETFGTQIKKGHAKNMNFATTAGGGVFAASIHSNVTGHGGDIIIIDDPHPVDDAGNPEKLAQLVDRFKRLMSRRNNPKRDRYLVIGHRISEQDLFAYLRTQKGWQSVVLPLVATRDVTYKTDYGKWRRRKGDVLRPDAFDEDEIEDLRKSSVNPDFDMLYQQDVDAETPFRIRPEHFLLAAPRDYEDLPVVLSIEPGVADGDRSSFSVIQAWASDERTMTLVDEFHERCDFEDLVRAVRKFRRRFRPIAVLVEKTANGPALISCLRRKWKERQQLIVPIVPRGSKTSRLLRHLEKIREGRVRLKQSGAFCEDCVAEFVAFPHGANDDRVDAFTQAADWLEQNPAVGQQPRKIPLRIPMVVATSQTVNSQSINPNLTRPDAPGLCAVRGNSSVFNPFRNRW